MALPTRATLYFFLALQLVCGALTGPTPGRLDISPLSSQSSVATSDDCSTACLNDALCRTFAYEETTQLCYIYAYRAGFAGISLTGHDSAWSYFEIPLGQRDSMKDALDSRRTAAKAGSGGSDGYLAYTREPLGNLTLTGVDSSSSVTVYVADAGECAAQCLRKRGVIDDSTGVRCRSFELHTVPENDGTHRCDLLPSDLLHDGSSWEPNPNVEHYERLTGTGCYLYTEDCPSATHLNDFNQAANGNPTVYETSCHALARPMHDSTCLALKTVPTYAWFAAGGSLSVWNPADLTEGCVIEAGDCPFTPLGRPDNWAAGTFRDSIAEFDSAAFSNAKSCMDQAEKWWTLCEKPESDLVYATFVESGARLGFPVPVCECDAVGELIDPTTKFSYCMLNSTDACKMGDGVTIYVRKEVNDGRPYPEILCDDVECPTPDVGLERCRLLSGPCNNLAYDTRDVLQMDLDGPTSESECFAKAEEIWAECANGLTDYVDVYWTASRAMMTFPEMDPTASSVDAIGAYLYNVPHCDDPTWLNCTSFADAGQARWQTFKVPNEEGTLEENHVRGMGFLWRGPEDTTLTLKLLAGDDFDPAAEGLEFDAMATVELQASEDPIWVTAPLDIVLTPDAIYTAVVQVNGELGYSTDADYTDGTGDLVWDYLFVLWQHADIPRMPRPFEAPLALPDDPINIFQFIFVSMVGLLLLAIAWHHYRKYRARKKEMEPVYERVTEEEVAPFRGGNSVRSTERSTKRSTARSPWRRDLGGDDDDLDHSGDSDSGVLDMSDDDSDGVPRPSGGAAKSWNVMKDEENEPVFLTIEDQQARMLAKPLRSDQPDKVPRPEADKPTPGGDEDSPDDHVTPGSVLQPDLATPSSQPTPGNQPADLLTGDAPADLLTPGCTQPPDNSGDLLTPSLAISDQSAINPSSNPSGPLFVSPKAADVGSPESHKSDQLFVSPKQPGLIDVGPTESAPLGGMPDTLREGPGPQPSASLHGITEPTQRTSRQPEFADPLSTPL